MPILVGERWAICGLHEAEVDVGSRVRIVLEPDPRATYGGGWQPSTQAMLIEMESIDFAGKTVLDAGCGNGILSIAAALSGGTVTAADTDPWARAIAAIQFARNNVRVSILDEIPDGAFDVLLANMGDVGSVEALLSTAGIVLVSTEPIGRRESGGAGTKPVYKKDARTVEKHRPGATRRDAGDGFVVVRG